MLAWPQRWTRTRGFIWAVALGTLLSLLVELLQVHASSRVSSLTDLVLNAAGTAIGALGAIIYLAMGSTIRLPGAAAGRPHPVPLGLIALWLAFRLAPFVPTIDWQKYKEALKPLFIDPQLIWLDVLRYIVGWLVVGYAVRQVWRREYSVFALVALAALVLVGRVVVVGKALAPAELAALMACIPIAAVLIVLTDRRRALVLCLMLAAIIMITGLKPFTFETSAHNFSWVPFMSSLNDSLEVNYSVLLEKCFWYFALIWLLTRRGSSVLAASLLTATLLAIIECLQVWIPGRSAEITDPLLALCGGALLSILGTPSTQRIRTAPGAYSSRP